MNKKLKALGKRICEACKDQGLIQAELAEKLQISVGHISNIEHDKKAFRIDIFIKITESPVFIRYIIELVQFYIDLKFV